MNQLLVTWMNNVCVYPPAEICFQSSDSKTEKRLQKLCEEVYSLGLTSVGKLPPLLGLKTAYRELEVLMVMLKTGTPVKQEFIVQVANAFKAEIKSALVVLTALHKKDALLSKYYDSWKVKYAELNSAVYDLTKDYLN